MSGSVVGLAGLIPALYFDQRLPGLMHVNAADNVLHLVVGVVAAAVGFFVREYARGNERMARM
jgi:hypothetical protein